MARAGARSKRAPVKAASKRGKTPKASPNAAFEKVRELCLALPGTKLTMTWGSPHFRVGEKIFCGCGDHDGKLILGVKLRLEHARQAVKEPRFWPAKYVGKHGWVSLDLAQRESWSEVAQLIRESYELIAPKALRAKLG
jgi:predicted DNA-binding protein (MmcQ/YjbR family)